VEHATFLLDVLGEAVRILIGLGVMVLYWLGLAIISSALTGIYRTGLYLYAREGKLSQGFGQELVQSAFAGKGPAGQWSTSRG
jgi:hypothetical protein